MGDRERFKVDVLKKALKTQRTEALNRENDLQNHLSGLWKKADRERKMLMGQVSELKNEVARKGVAKTLFNDVTSKLSDLKTTVSNIKDGSPSSDRGLWSFEDDEGSSLGVAASSSDHSSSGGRVDGSGESAVRGRVRSLEAKVSAQQQEIAGLQGQLSQREAAVSRLELRNAALTASLEEKEHQIQTMESRIARLKQRLKEANSYSPKPKSVADAVRGGYALEALGLTPAPPSSGWHLDGEEDSPLVPGLDEFKERLRDETAAPLLGMVESFVTAFVHKKPKLGDYAMVHHFLGAMENPFRSHRLWREADDDDVAETIDALEAFILGDEKVNASVMQSMEVAHAEQDHLLSRRLWCLQFIQPQHLDVKKVHATHPALPLARKMVTRITQVRSPQEKLECIFRAARIIFRMLNEPSSSSSSGRAQPASADDFLPLFILTVLKAQPQHLCAHLEFIATFRRPSQLAGERHYYLVQLQTAVAFIEHMDGAAVSMDLEEFDEKLREREQLWESRGGKGGGEDLEDVPGETGAEDAVHV
eukprot:CAMPEP_0196738342 /NCGR_PEP_ID=MMETSP1091-20130531/15759_1 /TAXON_ID=302021 /ORGANISM="Rhodomonas sp., Strain CCMP768" /LENGTH=534 /DNA_ID=CAMNT_0042082305 /DNA_START=186 /DNA_END=1787 /DNA_ORIENTATION=+